MNKNVKSCNDCVFAVIVEQGYSNWTVEGSDMHCSKNFNPNGTYDNFYGTAVQNQFAEECSSYLEGDCVTIDVDKDDMMRQSEDVNLKWSHYVSGFVTAAQIETIVGD